MTTAADEKTCPFCAETIKAAAKVCKHCGRDLPEPAATTARARKLDASSRWAYALLGVLGLAAAVAFLAREPHGGSASSARKMCQKFVMQTLRDPESAQWGEWQRWPAEQDQTAWFVTMEFRARNGMGGMNFEKRTCLVRHKGGGEWNLLSLL